MDLSAGYCQRTPEKGGGCMATTVSAPSVEDIRKESEKRGIEFYFAQFVDTSFTTDDVRQVRQ